MADVSPGRASSAQTTTSSANPESPVAAVPKGIAWFDRIGLFAPVDMSPLVFFRVFFASMMLYHVCSYLSTGTAELLYVTQEFHFTYTGFSWVKPLPGHASLIEFLVMGIAALGMLLGCFYRFSALVFAVCFIHLFLAEKAMYQNHYYLICLLSGLMVFVPAHRMWSIDAWRNKQLRSDLAPRLWLWLLRFQLAIPYVYGGIAKINSDWLQGMPMRMWLERRTWLPGVGQWLATDAGVYGVAWGGMLFDLMIVPALLWRRTRTIAFVTVLCFHLANSVLWSIGIFPWFMIGATALFFPSDTFRRVLTRRSIRPAATIPEANLPEHKRRRIVTAVCIYLMWQLVFPFRHALYGGSPSWTEEGIHFAWHMMLREKRAGIRIAIAETAGAQQRLLDPSEFLHPRQVVVLSKDPDMIVEFTGYLRQKLRDRGHDDINIRVSAFASLNGRDPQLLVDPTLNFAELERTWHTQPWIVPLRQPLQKVGWDLPMHQWEGMLADLVSSYETRAADSP